MSAGDFFVDCKGAGSKNTEPTSLPTIATGAASACISKPDAHCNALAKPVQACRSSPYGAEQCNISATSAMFGGNSCAGEVVCPSRYCNAETGNLASSNAFETDFEANAGLRL